MNGSTYRAIYEEVSRYQGLCKDLFAKVTNTEKYRAILSQYSFVDTPLNDHTSKIPLEHANLIGAVRDFVDFCSVIYDVVNREDWEWEKARGELKSKFDSLQNAFHQIDWI